jgi:hypothetical protein
MDMSGNLSYPKPRGRPPVGPGGGYASGGQVNVSDLPPPPSGPGPGASQRRGRPPVGPVIEVRLPADTLAALDAAAERDGVKRAELARLVLVREFPPVSIDNG